MTQGLEVRAALAGRLLDFAATLLPLAEPDWAGESAQPLIDEALAIGQAAQHAGARGVPELLRLLATGLRDRAMRAPEHGERDVAILFDWCVLASEHLCGRMSVSRVPDLVEGLSAIDWIPEMIPRMRDLLVARLSADIAEALPLPEPELDVIDVAAEAEQTTVPELVPEETGFIETMVEPAFAFSGLAPEAHPIDLPDEVSAERIIWISPEEQELAGTAVANQLLPALDAVATNTDPDRHAALVEDYHYQVGLVINALGLIGLDVVQSTATTVLAEVAILQALDPESSRDGCNLLATWQTCLLGWFQTEADPAMAEALLETLSDPNWAAPLEPSVVDALRAELLAVKVGRDPALNLALKVEVHAEDVLLDMAPDVVPSVIDGMLKELPGNCARLRTSLAALNQTGAIADIDEARRVAHTLKGDANTVGVRGIANLTHALEDILVALAKDPGVPARDVQILLEHAGDCVEAMADRVLGRGPAPDDALEVFGRVLNLANAVHRGERDLLGALAEGVEEPALRPSPPQAQTPQAAEGASVAESVASLQISVPLLDELLRLSSETIVLARQVEEQLRQVATEHGDLSRQNQFSRALVGQLDDLVALRGAALTSARLDDSREIDSLELDQYNELHVISRRLIETASDSNAHLMNLDHALVGLRDLSARQDRVHLELQQSVMNTRMVPVSHQVPRFQRVVRQTARTLDRPVDFFVHGESTLIDSEILDRMTEPLVHALRNAVDHGIESADRRQALGKPAHGRIELSIERHAGDIHFRLKDDGSGLNLEAIRRAAIERGLVDEDRVLDDDETARLILVPGFSTRSEATQVSGRGIGMDVVNRRVLELRGRMALHSTPGAGTEIDIILPASLNSAHVALARTQDGAVAIVTGSIKRFLSLQSDQFEWSEAGGLQVRIDELLVPAVALETLSGSNARRDMLEQASIGLVVADGQGGERVVVTRRIDEMREVIIKGLGPYFGAVPGLRGTTILGTGGLAPVVDLEQILRASSADGFRSLSSAASEALLDRIIIADDSLSVRRALQGLMEDAGFEVATASDGLEALDLVNGGRKPVCLILDLEMPRMNGLELASFVRNKNELSDIPIIMITSRTSEKHLQLARDAGVTEMLGKPYNEDQLVQMVRRLTQDPDTAPTRSKETSP